MPQLYLPAEHTDADLILAGLVAQRVDSAELYVVWTPERGQASPEVAAVLRDPAPSFRRGMAILLSALGELVKSMFARVPAEQPLPAPAPAEGVAKQTRPAA